jgi:hypothetical protein
MYLLCVSVLTFVLLERIRNSLSSASPEKSQLHYIRLINNSQVNDVNSG